MFNIASKPIGYTPDHIQELIDIKDRLYCVWQCAWKGDPMMVDHSEMMGRELYKMWNLLCDIIDSERSRLLYIEEEMKKFEQGFAYKAPIEEMKEMID